VDTHEAESRRVLAAVNSGGEVEVAKDAYVMRVRDEMHRYAGQCVDWGDQGRAIATLEHIKRLDRLHSVRAGDVHLASAERGRYGQDSDWRPGEHAPTAEDLGVT
jgi:hypothetical protein